MENKLLEFIKDVQETLYQDKAVKNVLYNRIVRGDIVHIGDDAKETIINIIIDLITLFDTTLDVYDEVYDHKDALQKLKEYKKEDKEEKLIRLAQQLEQLEKEYTELINEINDEEQV